MLISAVNNIIKVVAISLYVGDFPFSMFSTEKQNQKTSDFLFFDKLCVLCTVV